MKNSIVVLSPTMAYMPPIKQRFASRSNALSKKKSTPSAKSAHARPKSEIPMAWIILIPYFYFPGTCKCFVLDLRLGDF